MDINKKRATELCSKMTLNEKVGQLAQNFYGFNAYERDEKGNIVDGDSNNQVAGSRFARIISEVRRDTTVKAVVLRVNSPGGSVLAAEKIKAEIDLLQERVPVIASYGDYAASGGYWISANCDKIYTDATTLTGSIGVFSIIPDSGHQRCYRG